MNEKQAQALPAQALGEESAQQPLLFALDIGTRSVIGVLGVEENGLFRVIDVAMREHTRRTMIDGQIEDIVQVAAVAQAVREELETRQGVSLRRVCVAAAGRALKTVRSIGELTLDAPRVLTPRDVYELEMDAVQKARRRIVQENESTGGETSFYCVGHAVVRYLIDGYSFFTIKEHKAEKAQAEIIATFLPSAVVESLYGAMELAGLQVESVTLEPIAAMNAVIPQELRLLNLGLVDVGAGTSDIAISEGGSVAAYTMVTTAGDEISEELIRTCLVDFETAERMKQSAGKADCGDIAYENILGMSDTLTREAVLEKIRPAVELLAKTICAEMQAANGDKAPTAVFLVGGGAKTPFLAELVAQGLGLEPGKVALGGNNFFKRIAVSSRELAGPEYATPLGIALTAVSDDSRESLFLQVNGKQVLAAYSKEMTALDVLLLAGYSYTDLMGKSGKGLEYRFCGKDYRVRGERFQPAELRINGRSAAVSDKVYRGDTIEVEPAISGRDASLTVRQLLEYTPDDFFVFVNGQRCAIARVLLRNGQPAQPTDMIVTGDELTYAPLTVQDVCVLWGLETQNGTFFVNGQPCELSVALQRGDALTWSTELPEHTADKAAAAQPLQELLPQEQSATMRPVEIVKPDTAAEPRVSEPELVAAPELVEELLQQPAPQMVEAPPLAQTSPREAMENAQDVQPEQSAEEMLTQMSDSTLEHAQVPQEKALQGNAVEAKPVAPSDLSQAAPQVGKAEKQERKAADQDLTLAKAGLFETPVAGAGKIIRVTVNGSPVELPQRDTPYQFLDLLPLADVDFNKPQGDVLLLHNGREATYLDLITNGDEAVIGWKERDSR